MNFRAFLNIDMLLTESNKARLLRGAILNIVIDFSIGLDFAILFSPACPIRLPKK